jgi:hypothetical protein
MSGSDTTPPLPDEKRVPFVEDVSWCTMPDDADEKIASAVALLAIAEQELHLAIEQLQIFERADKQMVTLVVQGAFDKLNVARRALDEARELKKKG